MKLTDLEIPATPAYRAALDVATPYCSPALLNHSVRAYLWAAGYALERSIAFDAELLYVSAMLHDLALVKEFDNHTLPFEEAGGHVAWVFGAAAGLASRAPPSRCRDHRAAYAGCGGRCDRSRRLSARALDRHGYLGSTHRGLFRQACVPRCLRAIHAWAWLRSSSPRSKIRQRASRSA